MQQHREYPIFNSENYKGIRTSDTAPENVTTVVTEVWHHQPEQIEQQDQSSKLQNSKKSCPNLREGIPCQQYRCKCCREQLIKNHYRRCPSPLTQTSSRISQEVIKGDSRIQYVPFEKKAVDYIDVPKKVLKENRITVKDEEEHVRIQYIPREVTVTDYYAVEYVRHYIPEIIPESILEYVPIERKNTRKEYIPVERQILHYPIHSHDDQAPRYLGIQHTQDENVYLNVTEDKYDQWYRDYGYKKGEPIQKLNQRIRQKYESDKKQYYLRISKDYSEENAQSIQRHYKTYHEHSLTSEPRDNNSVDEKQQTSRSRVSESRK